MKKLIVSSENLKPALSKLSQAINSKHVIPALINIYCKVEPVGNGEATLKLTGTNTEITITYGLYCNASDAFEFLMPFEFASKVVALNKQAPLEIEAGVRKLKIKSIEDTYESKINAKLEDFPKLQGLPKEHSFEINSEILQLLNTAVITTGKLEYKPQLENVLLATGSGKITIASSDGAYMIFSQEVNAENITDSEELLLSPKVIKALEKSDKVNVHYNSKFIGFVSEDITIIATRREERFVDFKAAFPVDWPANLKIQKDTLTEALIKTMLTNDSLHITNLDLSNVKFMKMLSDDESIAVNVSVPVEYSGELKNITINSEKLLKLLSQVDAEEIQMAIHDDRKAIIITTTENDGYKALLMPIGKSK